MPNAVAFRGPRDGIIGTGWESCTSSSFGCRPEGTISITSDGGKTWRVLLRTPRPVVQVAVAGNDEQARFDDGETIGSTDGGRHWHPVVVGPGSVTGPCPSGSQVFVSGTWALCGWGASAGNQMKSVYRLAPGGWKRVALTPATRPKPGQLGTYGYAEGITMAPDGFGLIWESRGTLWTTRDGGVRWYGLPQVAQPEVDFGVDAIALPHGVAFALLANGGGEKRRLVETSDAGRTWRIVHSWS